MHRNKTTVPNGYFGKEDERDLFTITINKPQRETDLARSSHKELFFKLLVKTVGNICERVQFLVKTETLPYFNLRHYF